MRFPFAGVTRDENGTIIAGATIEVYETASVVPANVYTASFGGVSVNSVTSDTSGVFLFFLDSTEYSLGQLLKLIIYKGASIPLTYDPVAVPMYATGGWTIAPPWNTDGYIPLWNGTDSATLKDGVMLDTDDTLAADSDTRVPSQQAVKAYADLKIPLTYLDTDAALTADSDVKVATQKAVKAYADAKLSTTAIDIDGTLAANSDILVASQKATKTYADTKVAKSLFNANTILAANAEDTPVAVTVVGHRILGRVTGSNIAALTAAEIMSILLASTVAGDIPYFSNTNVLARLVKGTAGQYIRMNAGATAPEYAGLIGDLIGNCSGSSGSCTGNATTATYATSAGSATSALVATTATTANSIAAGAVTAAALPSVTAAITGAVPVAAANTERSYAGTSYTKKKQITINRAGTYTVYFGISSGNDGVDTAYGKVYKNDVGFGTERTTLTTAYTYFSQDLAFAAGDTCQLYIKNSNGATATSCKEFQLFCNDPLLVTVNTD